MSWTLGPFERAGVVLGEQPELGFDCPVAGRRVAWAAKDVFNPAAVVREGRVHLLFRAEDDSGSTKGTSRLGLATSDDGLRFTVEPEPVLFPEPGPWQPWEWPGGCEDPRVVEHPDGGYVCLYSAFDGTTARLCVASSDDLRHWERRGSAFAGTAHPRRWSKSGSVVTELRSGRLVAARLPDGRFWMYWGEGVCFAATSEDLVSWTPVEFDPAADRYLTFLPARGAPGGGHWNVHRVPGHDVLRPALFPRPGRFDALLVEPGPPALLTDAGVLLVYNGARVPPGRSAPGVVYEPGQALFDPAEPGSCIGRSSEPFLTVRGADEISGQVDNVCFAEGLVHFGGRWLLYYGMADSRIGCARAAG